MIQPVIDNLQPDQPLGVLTNFPQKINVVNDLNYFVDKEHITDAIQNLGELSFEYLNLLCINSADEVEDRLNKESIKSIAALRNYRHNSFPVKEESYLAIISTIAYYLPDFNSSIGQSNYNQLYSLGVILIAHPEIRDLYLRAFFQHTKDQLSSEGITETNDRSTEYNWQIEECIRVLLLLAEQIRTNFSAVHNSRFEASEQ